jgi:CheY-like chemotaxis protein
MAGELHGWGVFLGCHRRRRSVYTQGVSAPAADTRLSCKDILISVGAPAVLPDNFPECLIADLQMSEMSGLELHQRLTFKGLDIPTIIITAHDDADVRPIRLTRRASVRIALDSEHGADMLGGPSRALTDIVTAYALLVPRAQEKSMTAKEPARVFAPI